MSSFLSCCYAVECADAGGGRRMDGLPPSATSDRGECRDHCRASNECGERAEEQVTAIRRQITITARPRQRTFSRTRWGSP